MTTIKYNITLGTREQADQDSCISNEKNQLILMENLAGDVKKCNSDFSISGPLSETIQLGNVTLQTGAPVVWDSQNLRATNNPDAQKYICPPMRPGWFQYFYLKKYFGV